MVAHTLSLTHQNSPTLPRSHTHSLACGRRTLMTTMIVLEYFIYILKKKMSGPGVRALRREARVGGSRVPLRNSSSLSASFLHPHRHQLLGVLLLRTAQSWLQLPIHLSLIYLAAYLQNRTGGKINVCLCLHYTRAKENKLYLHIHLFIYRSKWIYALGDEHTIDPNPPRSYINGELVAPRDGSGEKSV